MNWRRSRGRLVDPCVTGRASAGSRVLLIEEIVSAVRAGDDGRIGHLLREFSVKADIASLFALRDALNCDLLADEPSSQ